MEEIIACLYADKWSREEKNGDVGEKGDVLE